MKLVRRIGLIGATWLLLAAATQQRQPPPVTKHSPPSVREAYADWSVESLGAAFSASTANSSGSEFGVICAETCATFISQGSECEEDGEFPVLVNSSAGAFNASFACKKLGTLHLLMAPLNDTVVDSMEIGGELGIAVPLQSGQFKVFLSQALFEPLDER